jgi:hypothetical protein
MTLFKKTSALKCTHKWDTMHSGDVEYRRFCHRCQVFAFNLHLMDEQERSEFEKSIEDKQSQAFLRNDGKVLFSPSLAARTTPIEYITVLSLTLMLSAAAFGYARSALQVTLSQSFSTVVSQLSVCNCCIDHRTGRLKEGLYMDSHNNIRAISQQ